MRAFSPFDLIDEAAAEAHGIANRVASALALARVAAGCYSLKHSAVDELIVAVMEIGHSELDDASHDRTGGAVAGC